MNKIIGALLLASSSIILNSCQKDYKSNPDTNPEFNTSQGTFKCEINGQLMTAEFKSANRNQNDEGTVNSLTISGLKYLEKRLETDYQTVNLVINWYDGPKEYGFFDGQAGGNFIFSSKETGTANYVIHSSFNEGNVLNLSEYGDRSKGTFAFKALNVDNIYDTLYITNGEFDFPNN